MSTFFRVPILTAKRSILFIFYLEIFWGNYVLNFKFSPSKKGKLYSAGKPFQGWEEVFSFFFCLISNIFKYKNAILNLFLKLTKIRLKEKQP